MCGCSADNADQVRRHRPWTLLPCHPSKAVMYPASRFVEFAILVAPEQYLWFSHAIGSVEMDS